MVSFTALHIRRLAPALVAAGLLLRVWQYSDADSALWLDEIAVARNVLERPLNRLLLEPLDYDQAAPKGFLLAEYVAVGMAGPSERALRLWPCWFSQPAAIVAIALAGVLTVDGFARAGWAAGNRPAAGST